VLWLNNVRYRQLPLLVDGHCGTHDGWLNLYNARRLKPGGVLEPVYFDSQWVMTSPDVRVVVTYDN